jgi:RNA polymerase-binding transcription factor DksA
VEEKKIDAVAPADLLHSENYTTKEVRDERYAICKECPRLISITRTCKECGCFMALKTWLKDASCPLDKWGTVE